MTLIENIQACVNLEVPQDLPVFALSQEFDAHYADLHYEEYIRDSETIVETQLLVRERFGWDWFWLHVDDTLEFEPLGVGVQAGQDIVPAVCGFLPFDRETLSGLKVPDATRDARLPMLLEAIHGLRSAAGDNACVTGRIGAPFSAVTLIFGMAETYMMMMDDPQLVRDAMKFTEELALSVGLAQIEAGAHALWLGDCNASTHLMSPRQFEEWALEPCLRVTRAFKEAGAFVFLHNSEENLEGLKAQALTEPSVLSIGPGMDMAKAKPELPNVAIMGNVDPIGLLQLGSASQVAAETDRLVRLAASGGMILNSGECIPREAKGPNLHTMYDTAKKVWNIAHSR